MKIKVNRNIIWTNIFAETLVKSGVRYACISPGSRSTPLTFAFAQNKNIKTFVNIDERSNGFFALGLAKATKTPVVLICTSGTAVAEFYPAIIEAYQNRIPLIVCTADRPPELQNRGANQTINQYNIYANHILHFENAGLPDISNDKIDYIRSLARFSFEKSINESGPVHINFPFNKPFEPDDFTDEIDEGVLNFSSENIFEPKKISNEIDEEKFSEIVNTISQSSKGLIIVGPNEGDEFFATNIIELSKRINAPVLADASSNLRFGKFAKENIISNFEGFIRTKKFTKENIPDFIFQFGRTVTSKGLETYLEKVQTKRFLINKFGDVFDPANKAEFSLAISAVEFCQKAISIFNESNFENNKIYLNKFIEAENVSNQILEDYFLNKKFPFEKFIIDELIELIPAESNLMISNSMPIRDFDYFAKKSDKLISVFQNRGASGIDGIISTALGIYTATKKITLLLTGDLAFYYDMNGLLAARNYKIPLVIILINNNGGGIFEMLPVSKYGNVFDEFFTTPHNLDFSIFVTGYGGNYFSPKTKNEFKESLERSISEKTFSVIEIKTNSKISAELRKEYWNKIQERIDK